MKKLIKCISYILSFLLMLCIIGLIVINIAKTKILKESYIIDVLDKVNYYSRVSENIESNFENYYYQSGLEHYVIENLYDEKKVKDDTLQIIHAIYNNIDVNVETESIKEKLRNNIDDMLETQNKKIDSSEQETVNTFINIIAETYESEITSYESGIKMIAKVMDKLENIINKVSKLMLIFTIVLIILIVIFNIKKLVNITRYIGISSLASGLVCVLGNIGLKASIKIDNIFILTTSISEALKYIIKDILGNIQMVGIVLLIIGLILIVIHALIQNEEK